MTELRLLPTTSRLTRSLGRFSRASGPVKIFGLVVAPHGSRNGRTYGKSGFSRIAREAGLALERGAYPLAGASARRGVSAIRRQARYRCWFG